MGRIKCGRCGTEFEFDGRPSLTGTVAECKCPLCGYSKREVQESDKSKTQRVLKD